MGKKMRKAEEEKDGEGMGLAILVNAMPCKRLANGGVGALRPGTTLPISHCARVLKLPAHTHFFSLPGLCGPLHQLSISPSPPPKKSQFSQSRRVDSSCHYPPRQPGAWPLQRRVHHRLFQQVFSRFSFTYLGFPIYSSNQAPAHTYREGERSTAFRGVIALARTYSVDAQKT